MKKLSIATIIAGAMIFSACNGNTNSSGTADSTSTMSNADTSMNKMNATDTSKATVDQNAVNFAKDAATGGMMEVQLGKIAQDKAASKAVKDFGKMIVEDHTSLNNELKDIASKKNIDLPTSVTTDQQQTIDKLNKETGSKFDKDYISTMVEDHKTDIGNFKKAADNISDADLKDFITKALPTLQKHLDKAEEIKKKM